MPAYTLAITSCMRHTLLQTTLESFFNTVDQNPASIFVVEDSNLPMPEFLKKYRHIPTIWNNNGTRRGQAYTVRRLINLLPDNPYTFWLEDDWLFQESGYLRQSEDILSKYPDISQVSLRGNDCNGHPLVKDARYPFLIQERGWRGGWGGYSFNPALCRTKDLKAMRKYMTPYIGKAGLGCELELSQIHIQAGHSIAVLRTEPYVTHIGGGKSRAIETLPPYTAPRVLIAIKAGHSRCCECSGRLLPVSCLGYRPS